MSAITDEDIDLLRGIADRLRSDAQLTYYGSYNGGDPRNFSPDPECSTDEERERHRLDCELWERGEGVDHGSHHSPIGSPTDTPVVVINEAMGWQTTQRYGLGVVSDTDPELLKLALDLDDLIDRIRQVSP